MLKIEITAVQKWLLTVLTADGKFFVRPTDGNWLIYPSDQWHRPGIVQSNDYRFILAVDVEYVL
jgi:hypothetical protein